MIKYNFKNKIILINIIMYCNNKQFAIGMFYLFNILFIYLLSNYQFVYI